MTADPHAGQPVLDLGARLEDARLAMILVHGRGGSAADMIGLARQLDEQDVTFLAPEAAGNTWYPYSFLSPIEQNEPGLSSALNLVDTLVRSVGERGVPADRVVVLGFSQGACLSLEFAARHPRRYAGIAGLSGGLIGPDVASASYSGSLDGTPVFLGCSDRDPHIPVLRVRESADILSRLGGAVDARIYPGMGHTINDDELQAVRQLIRNRSVSARRS